MALLLTLDASIFVAACRRHEPGYTTSRALLDGLRAAALPLIEPALLPIEVGAALRHTGSSAVLAREYAETILTLPHLTVVAVDEPMARRALAMAIQYQLRGADALYITVASLYGAHLVTLDKEQLRRAPSSVHASKPEAAAALLPS